MDYKKLYEKAVERAKTLTNSGFNDFDFVKHIFPELKESEDERIKNEIINFIKDNTLTYTNRGSEIQMKWIAWLEKQGQTFTKKDVDDAYLKGVCDAKQELEKQGEKLPVGFYYVNSEGKKFYSDTFKYGDVILHVEKQGEQKSNPCDGCINRKGCINCENGELREVEQKPADKVEPKFKVGDWINGYYTNYKVLSANNEGHVVEDIDGNKINILFENEKFHRLWTIQDAKDGDVLACENGWTCIFKCLNDNLFSSHCFMDDEGWFCENGGQGHTLDERICGEIQPATKEQCDTLFQKMKEAGYEWDNEKKELKKIEQKPAWSEEDSPYYDDICEMLINLLHSETTDVNKGAVQKDLDWLMSLRPQSHWKPSDEQIKAIKWVMDGDNPENWNITLKNLYQDLKKLKG